MSSERILDSFIVGTNSNHESNNSLNTIVSCELCFAPSVALSDDDSFGVLQWIPQGSQGSQEDRQPIQLKRLEE
jgi:hypothetical protein